jgi:hypothetical protein
MTKYRVFIEAVQDPEDPVLVKRLSKLSRKDEKSVVVLLDSLPAVLAEDLDLEAAQSLKTYLEPVGARVLLKEIRDSVPERTPPAPPDPTSKGAGDDIVGLNFFKRLSWGFEIFGHTWGRQVLLFLMFFGISMAGQMAVAMFTGGVGLNAVDPHDPLSGLRLLQSPGFLVGMTAFQLIVMLAGFWYQASLIRLIAAFMEDSETATLGALAGQAWQRVPELVTAVGLVMLPLFLGFGLTALGGSALLLPDNPVLLAWLVLGVSLGMLAVTVGLALVGPVAVLESLGPWAAVKRAWALSRGWRWRLFGNLTLLIIGMLIFLLGMQLLFAFLLPVSLYGNALADLGVGGFLLSGLAVLLLFVAFSLLAAFLFIFFLTAFYFEARVLDEGWKPCWAVVPHPSWPISEDEPEPASGRGLRAWRELAVYSILALLLLWAVLAGMGGWMAQLMPISGATGDREFSIVVGGGASSMDATPPDASTLPAGISVELSSDGRVIEGALDVRAVLNPGGILPQEVKGPGLMELRVQRVVGSGGHELLAAEDPDRRGESARLWLQNDGRGHLWASRKVTLEREKGASTVAAIQGELLLTLPGDVQRIELGPSDVDVTTRLPSGGNLTLSRLEGGDAQLRAKGSEIVAVAAMNRTGGSVESIGYSSVEIAGVTEYTAQFPEPVAKVVVTVAGGKRNITLPFRLQPGTPLVLQP